MLTVRQTELVDAISNGSAVTISEAGAGYAHASSARQAALTPAVREAIVERVRRDIERAAPIALKILRDIMQDENVRPATRVDAAKTILDRAGFIAPKAQEREDLAGFDPAKASEQELRAFLNRAETELGNRARVVTIDNDKVDKPLDWLG